MLDRIKELPAMTVAKADDPRCYVGEGVDATQTDDGLAIKGRFDLDTKFGKSAYKVVKGRRMSGLSIDYWTSEARGCSRWRDR